MKAKKSKFNLQEIQVILTISGYNLMKILNHYEETHVMKQIPMS